MDFIDNWLLMALLTPVAWSITSLIDSCLVGHEVIETPLEGTVISGLFGALPVIAIMLIGIESGGGLANSLVSMPGNFVTGLPGFTFDRAIATSILAGVAYFLHLHLYFKALFQLNDVSGAETCLALSVVVVPLFAHLLLGEFLPPRYYLAFCLAGVGILFYCWSGFRLAGISVVVYLMLAVGSVSISMVLQARAFESVSYSQATLVFSLTCFVMSILYIAAHGKLRARVVSIFRQHSTLFICAELIGLVALLASHRAADQGPSVSLVVLIECLLPLLIIALSLAFVKVDRHFPFLSSTSLTALTQQFAASGEKLFALVLLMLSMTVIAI